tara:strand:+ start:4319 stop:4672 length:354 start_codon:yes stop_codon:yes gene_type:complete
MKAADDNGIAQCVTCGKRDHYKNMQGGHFIPRSHTKWSLEQINVWTQCPYCNLWGMKSGGTAAQAYTIFMIDMFGKDFVDEMIRTKSHPVKRYKQDYEEILAELKEQIKQQEKRILL